MLQPKYLIEKIEKFPLRWYLDKPSPGQAISGDWNTIYIEGWALNDPSGKISEIVIKDNASSKEKAFGFTKERPDVIKYFHGKAHGSDQLKCGFQINCAFYPDGLALGFRINGNTYWAATIKPSQNSVLQGRQGWLFIDSDTNNSTLQFTGRHPTNKNWLDQWNYFFEETERFLGQGNHHTFLVSPTKEEIFQDLYPWSRISTPLISVLNENFKERIVWPVKDLTQHRYLSYDAAESHWNDYGANLALNNCLIELGEPTPPPQRYEVVTINGDLGDKISPRIKSTRLRTISSDGVLESYNNKIINHGNIKAYTNDLATTGKKLIVFGGSSANFFLTYAANVFSETIFIHTTGSIDRRLIDKHQPDLIILQTNQRFLVTPPPPFIDVSRYVKSKSITSHQKK